MNEIPAPRKLTRHVASLLYPGGKPVIAHSESKEQINRQPCSTLNFYQSFSIL